MAANLQSRVLVASLGKRLAGQIQSRAAPITLRSVHTSVYDKNPDESVSTVVPDHVIPPQTEYWAPHPKTGVFGPAMIDSLSSGQESGVHASAGAESSVLEEKAFFRPQEGLEKPPVQVQP